jgi:hypothetical protein
VSQVYEKDIKIPFVGEKLGLKGIDLLWGIPSKLQS